MRERKGGRPPHLPLCPPSSPCVGEEGGDQRSSGNPVPASFSDAASIHHITPLPRGGSGAGDEGRPHLPPCPLPLPHGERKGEMSVAVAILCLRLSTMPRLHTTSPLSRAAGEGLGVRAARRAGEGPRVRATRRAGEGPGVRAARRTKGSQADYPALSLNPLTSRLCHYCPTGRTLQSLKSRPSIRALVDVMIR